MRTRFTNTIFFVATVLASVFTLFFGIYEYRREHAFRVDILHSQLQLNNYHVAPLLSGPPLISPGGEDTVLANSLSFGGVGLLPAGEMQGSIGGLDKRGELSAAIRVTVTDTLGNVLYDTEEADVHLMGNHLQREEIQEALGQGSGYAIKRASETNGEKYFYSATRFGDRIVRSSVPYSAELTSSLEHDYTFLYYTASILALIAIAMYFRQRFEHSEREKQRIKRQLTENAAHELKTPAATIEGYLETLVSNPSLPQEKRDEFLKKCYAQSQRMSQLLADMSTLTRLDEAHIQRPCTPIDAAVILRQIQEETAAAFSQQRIQLRLLIPESLPMRGDASLIYSLFRNIFSNTLAYATDATYFRVMVKVVGSRYVFTFSDNGAGVPVEHLPHIFERFYRIDKGRSRRLGGTGLGLAIVKNIALQYNGSVTAMQTPKGGLTIEIELAM